MREITGERVNTLGLALGGLFRLMQGLHELLAEASSLVLLP